MDEAKGAREMKVQVRGRAAVVQQGVRVLVASLFCVVFFCFLFFVILVLFANHVRWLCCVYVGS